MTYDLIRIRIKIRTLRTENREPRTENYSPRFPTLIK